MTIERELTPPEPPVLGLWAAHITVTLRGDGINEDIAQRIIDQCDDIDDADDGDGWVSVRCLHQGQGHVDHIEAEAYAEGNRHADQLLAAARKMPLGLSLVTTIDVDMDRMDDIYPDPDRHKDFLPI